MSDKDSAELTALTVETAAPRPVDVVPCPDCHTTGCALCGYSGTLTVELEQ